MNKKNTRITPKQKTNTYRPHKETASSQRLRAFTSFLWANKHIYEKCRYFRRG